MKGNSEAVYSNKLCYIDVVHCNWKIDSVILFFFFIYSYIFDHLLLLRALPGPEGSGTHCNLNKQMNHCLVRALELKQQSQQARPQKCFSSCVVKVHLSVQKQPPLLFMPENKICLFFPPDIH